MNLSIPSLMLVMVLAACGGGAPDETATDGAPAYEPPVRGTSRLLEREPDLCGASAYGNLVGQPEAVIATQGITRKVRVIPYGDIFTQEYDGYRMNFQLRADGTIGAVKCG